MTRQARDERRKGWHAFLLPAGLSLMVGTLFAIGVVLLDIPNSGTNPLPRIIPVDSLSGASGAAPPFAVPNGRLAEIGGFMAYRGYAAITVTIAVALIITALIALRSFVPNARVRRILQAMLAGQALAAVLANLSLGSGMSASVGEMICVPGMVAPSWHVCALEKVGHLGPIRLHYGFNAFVDATCVVATACAIFVIFIVASTRPPKGLPAIIESSERCVTVLLASASLMLVAVALIDKSFLHWAFAGSLALERPPGDVLAYISGTVTLNGALETTLLAVTWFVSLLLLARGGQGPTDPAKALSGFSVYNLSAILAPALSAIAANLLSGQ